MAVSIDGTVKTTVDCYSATPAYGVLLYEATSLANGQHTISIRATGQKNTSSSGTSAILDAFSYLQPDTSTPAHPVRAASLEKTTMLRILGQTVTLPEAFSHKNFSVDITDFHGKIVRHLEYRAGALVKTSGNESMGKGIFFAKFKSKEGYWISKLLFAK